MAKSKKKSNFWKLFLAIIICEIAVVISGLVSQADTNVWFKALNKPSWNPPSYFFGPAWIFLYLLMGISIWLIWESHAKESLKINAELVFALQLFLNFLWSILLFRFHSPLLALITIVLLLTVVLFTFYYFVRISFIAAGLLSPYLAWLLFVAVINFSIWSMNKTVVVQTPIIHHNFSK
ncbi:MAG TPA: TspO/MBR family protein [Saprospiraceae bacterium]|nr:TspO/MBR family protein [Saprospiraceae bacterium]